MSYVVAGIGELLWDEFPEWRRMGGAPVNFTYHCCQLGGDGYPVSGVGEDVAGRELLASVSSLGLETRYIQRRPALPTGSVKVVLDDEGKPHYEIAERVAWDDIAPGQALWDLADHLDAVCFGTLAQRERVSRETIQQFVGACPTHCLRIYDVNLRQTFYSKAVIESSLGLANILKVSDEELSVLAGLLGLNGGVDDQIEQLIARYNLRLVAYTRGGHGSLLVTPGERVDYAGGETMVVDTVGAGDSYTAAMCMALLHEYTLVDVMRKASGVASYVCGQRGATPVLPEALVADFDIGHAPISVR